MEGVINNNPFCHLAISPLYFKNQRLGTDWQLTVASLLALVSCQPYTYELLQLWICLDLHLLVLNSELYIYGRANLFRFFQPELVTGIRCLMMIMTT